MSKSQKFDSQKPNLALIDPRFMEEMARVLQSGEEKYGRLNWKEPGLNFERLIAAAQRHIAMFKGGEDIDPESGQHHLSHAASGLMMLFNLQDSGRSDLDDRRFKREQ